MERERKERRQSMMQVSVIFLHAHCGSHDTDTWQRKNARKAEEERNIAAGNPGDVDFIGMVRHWRSKHAETRQPHDYTTNDRICIAVRKRPTTDKEREKNDHDVITCLNPNVWVHSAKVRVDGISKYLEHSNFQFDHAFDEHTDTSTVYRCTTEPLLRFFLQGGVSTIFAFGQTGSGKSFTISGIQQLLADDLYRMLPSGTYITVSFFEMYSGAILDLLNHRNRLKVMEDRKGEIVITGLSEQEAECATDLLDILDAGNMERTTHATEANDTSSRSHALLQINLRNVQTKQTVGKLSLIDLAGSERWTDTRSHDSKRREESADINTSLLALKECIRSFSAGAPHVPYRQSKLTMILKDCFTSDRAKTSIIATVSPGSSASDHTVNTLRYADMTKSRKKQAKKSPLRGTNTAAPASGRSPVGSSTKAATRNSVSKETNRNPPPVTKPKTTSKVVESKSSHVVIKPSPKSKGISTKQSSKPNAAGTKPSPKPRGTTSARQKVAKRDDPSSEKAKANLDELKEQINAHHMKTIQAFTSILSHEGEMIDRGHEVLYDKDVEEYAEELDSVLNQKEVLLLKMKALISDYRHASATSTTSNF